MHLRFLKPCAITFEQKTDSGTEKRRRFHKGDTLPIAAIESEGLSTVSGYYTVYLARETGWLASGLYAKGLFEIVFP